MRAAGTLLVVLGAALVSLGLLLRLGLPLKRLGRLPGDIIIHRSHVTLYFPLATCLLASLILSAVVFLILKLTGRR